MTNDKNVKKEGKHFHSEINFVDSFILVRQNYYLTKRKGEILIRSKSHLFIAILGLFFVYFPLFKESITIFTTNVHLVYGAGIRTHDHLIIVQLSQYLKWPLVQKLCLPSLWTNNLIIKKFSSIYDKDCWVNSNSKLQCTDFFDDAKVFIVVNDFWHCTILKQACPDRT